MGRRKSVEEYAEEIRQRREGDEESEPDRSAVPFQMLSGHDKRQLNELFDLLHEHGYLTTGSWQISGGSPNEPKHVTLTALLPMEEE